MDTRTTTLMAALVVALALVGTAPGQAGAVDPNCDKDFDIPDSEPLVARSLPKNSSEVGAIDVTGQDPVTVRVQLLTEGLISFGVFTMDPECGVAPSTMSECDDDQDVKTEDEIDPGEVDCQLQPGEEYFFHVVNDSDDDHLYKVWER